jgi:broad specificity phosphatase PhoE
MLADRVRSILDDVTRDTVIVSHGGVARAFLALACGVSSRQAASMDIWQGRILVIEGRKHRWV